jgi:hypothetical protein
MCIDNCEKEERVITPEEQRLIDLRYEIYQVFERFAGEYGISPYLTDEESGESLEIEAVLEEVIDKYRDIVSISQVDSIETFDNPSYTTGAIMIAMVNSVNGLETILESWEIG